MRYAKTIVFVCMFMVLTMMSPWVAAQETATQAALDRLLQEGINAYYASDYQTALQKWQAGLDQARTLNEIHYIGNFLDNIGSVYESRGQYEKALTFHKQALMIFRELKDRQGEGISLINIGNVYWRWGQYEEALVFYKQALAIFRKLEDRQGEGTTLNNIGIVYWRWGQYKEALASYKQALMISRELGDRHGEGGALGNIGLMYRSWGQYEEALASYKQALTIFRKLGDKNREGIVLTNIGNVFWSLGQYEKVLASYKQALTIFRKLEDRQGEGIALDNIGNVYQSWEQYEEALTAHKQALTIFRELGDRHGEGRALGNIGNVHETLRQYQKALTTHKQALTIFRELGDRNGEGNVLNNIGVVYVNVGQYQNASLAFQDSLSIHEALGGLDSLWLAQRGLASVEVRLNQSEIAINHYEKALDTIEQLRTGLMEKEQKLSFIQNKLFVYDELIDLLQDLHQTHPNKDYDRQALEIFERKQGRVFLEEMGQSGARLFVGIPDDILKRELDLELQLEQTRKQLVDERSKIIMEQNKERIRSLEDREKTLLSEQETLQTSIKTDYPDYYALRYPKPAALSDLKQNILQPGELLLVYGVMKEQTVLWIVSKQDFSLVPLDISEEELQQEVEAFRTSPNAIIEAVSSGQPLKAIQLAGDTLDDMAQASYTLYQRLFPEAVRPLIAQAQILYVILTGPLYGLPFEALVTETPEDNKTPHYLLQDHSITYLSSASLLKILRDAQARRKQTTTYPLLAFANPVYEPIPDPSQEGNVSFRSMRSEKYLALMGGSQFAPLPETEKQAKVIANILDAPEASEPLQLRERASRSNVLRLNEQERLDDYRYLLFSAHAILPGEVDHVNQPAIVLSYPETEGYLTMADVFALQLNAALVALSACNTGRGEQIRGEGVMGLTRAFMYAGTPAVGITLWSVDSNASAEINIRFFRHLKAGTNFADALRQAKLDLLAEAEEDSDLEHFRHPFFWAPFVVFGDAR